MERSAAESRDEARAAYDTRGGWEEEDEGRGGGVAG